MDFGHLGSLTRSQGQIKELPCGHFRGHISCSIDLKIGRNVCLDEISDEFPEVTFHAQLINFLVYWTIN